MTQPIQMTASRTAASPLLGTQSAKNLKITLIALAALSSFATMMVLPWSFSIPLSAVMLGSALAIGCLIDYSQTPHSSTCIQTEDFPPPPSVIVSRTVYRDHPSVLIVPTSQNVRPCYGSHHYHHTPLGTGCVPFMAPLANPARAHHHHAPVGTGSFTPVVQPANPSVAHAPQWKSSGGSSIGQAFFTAARAPVGHR
jgi:hypothetical protein